MTIQQSERAGEHNPKPTRITADGVDIGAGASTGSNKSSSTDRADGATSTAEARKGTDDLKAKCLLTRRDGGDRMKHKILTDCSDCRIDLTLDLTGDGQVIAEVPSNGRRGSKRVEAYTATGSAVRGLRRRPAGLGLPRLRVRRLLRGGAGLMPPIVIRDLPICVPCALVIEGGYGENPEARAARIAAKWPDTVFTVTDEETFFSSKPCVTCGDTDAGDRMTATATMED